MLQRNDSKKLSSKNKVLRLYFVYRAAFFSCHLQLCLDKLCGTLLTIGSGCLDFYMPQDSTIETILYSGSPNRHTRRYDPPESKTREGLVSLPPPPKEDKDIISKKV